LMGWIVLHHFIQEIDTHGSQSGCKGSQVHLAEMNRAEDLVCSYGRFSCRICTGHGIKKTNIYFTLPLCSPRVTENSQPTCLAH
jgi:hypothetical protein